MSNSFDNQLRIEDLEARVKALAIYVGLEIETEPVITEEQTDPDA